MRGTFGLIFEPGHRHLMMWAPQKIDWLALGDEQEFERAIEELLSSNPVVSGTLTRPTGHKGLRELYSEVSFVAQRELEKALLNPGAYHSSGLVQTAVVDGVNKHLIISHYLFLLFRCRPKPAYCPISSGQVWFPASYLIIKGREVFDWKTGTPLRAFYDPVTTLKGRRPSITLSADKDGLYTMVPVSHVGGSTSVKVDLGRGRVYACCFFVYRASWVMLLGDRGASNFAGLRLGHSEFDGVLKVARRKSSP
jgi:hypothetical protein